MRINKITYTFTHNKEFINRETINAGKKKKKPKKPRYKGSELCVDSLPSPSELDVFG